MADVSSPANAHALSPTKHASIPAAAPAPDPHPLINAHEAILGDYLNRPVSDILSRLGLPASGAAPSPAAPPPAPEQGASNTDVPPPAGGAQTPFDPMQLIQPVTDALGTLGSGQLGGMDPTQIFGGLSQALQSAAQSIGPAVSQLASVWQGAAGTAATGKAVTAMEDGAKVASQSGQLSQSVTAVAATVAQARMRLMTIISEFTAKIAAIGPNIVFPWGMAAAIQAANEAVTETDEVITETQGTVATHAAHVAGVGNQVPVNAVANGAGEASMTGARSALAAPTGAIAGQGLSGALGPMMQAATGMISPIMQGVGAATDATRSGGAAARPPDGGQPPPPKVDGAAAIPPRGIGAGPGLGHRGAEITPARSTSLSAPHGDSTSPHVTRGATAVESAGLGGMPMGGMPMGQRTSGGKDTNHNAASFLHTTDQGDALVGDDTAEVGPAVVGEAVKSRPDVDLRI
ncbi:hypothetical protein MARA_01660 (plasmid) [Mycolicibacterium arabiense]|uniref:Uncharacterized protein n=1 Tax=Mycolicibacterium arabiense TaxID=1286181 RepID=A0A7I7RRQ6_9MYCO|nr:hypothetical protein [Mycolicibacterium arabiense]MCV7376925.1 hypothetical protein [Mycolicibacterium arabiense]BBY46736.1 hypothetical protein MARA_01660 [Mycolicibacterium arabiense]